MPRVTLSNLTQEYIRVLEKRGMDKDNAKILAERFANMGWEGIYSHGINRFPVFISQVDQGDIDLNAVPEKIQSLGALEQWDCNCGPGPLNAITCVKRAMEISDTYGVGVVAAKNSNHWMRGGEYPLYAARKGYACIAATNSLAVMPAWGGKDAKIGTNPLVIGIPGNPPALLDMSCSLYSFGKLQVSQLEGKELEVYGGYDEQGNLSKDPNAILQTKRVLPAGYWKGSALSIVLDMLLVFLSGGNSTVEITQDLNAEKAVSQMFIAFNVNQNQSPHVFEEKIRRIIDFVKESDLVDPDKAVRIPGANIEDIIAEHNANGGMPIDDGIWAQITSL